MSAAAERLPYLPTLAQFEALEIDPERFGHEAHVYVAWSYLQELELIEAIAAYRSVLKRLVAKLGAEGKYHETITWFYMVEIAGRLAADPDVSWAQFRAQHDDLFNTRPMLAVSRYGEERLFSDLARSQFVLPAA